MNTNIAQLRSLDKQHRHTSCPPENVILSRILRRVLVGGHDCLTARLPAVEHQLSDPYRDDVVDAGLSRVAAGLGVLDRHDHSRNSHRALSLVAQ